MDTPSKRTKTYFSKGRLEAFSDGVFAIAITLLVLDFRLPERLSQPDFYNELWGLGPKAASFLLSFALIGTYWLAQHSVLNGFVRQVDRVLIWLNMGLLLGVVLIPFLASLLGSYGEYYGSVFLYGANLILIGVIMLLIARYVGSTPDVQAESLDKYALGYFRFRAWIAIALYTLAILVALLSTFAGVVIYFLVPLLFIQPVAVERIWSILGRRNKA